MRHNTFLTFESVAKIILKCDQSDERLPVIQDISLGLETPVGSKNVEDQGCKDCLR